LFIKQVYPSVAQCEGNNGARHEQHVVGSDSVAMHGKGREGKAKALTEVVGHLPLGLAGLRVHKVPVIAEIISCE
jgi:hypothetical protein